MSDLDTEHRPSRRLWILAAVAALVLHLGGAALAFAHLKADKDGDGLGANVTEFAVEMESPKEPDDDLPPGPVAEDQQASAPQVEQKAELKQTDLPQEKPIESEDPDRVVSPNNSKKPQEEDPAPAAVQAENAPEQDASQAASPQKLDEASRESDQAKAPSLGIGKDKLKLTAKWGRMISAYFELHKRYPKVERNKDAKVKVSLVLNRLGHVVSLAIAESSGDPLFDDEALSMIRRSDPVPPPPAALTDDTFSYSLDVDFKTKK